MTTSQVLPARLPESHALQLAVAGYLARFKFLSRTHVESDLRAFLGWCADRSLDPLAAGRPQVELYVRWMQEIRRFKPSTVSRRTAIVAGFYASVTSVRSTATGSCASPAKAAGPSSSHSRRRSAARSDRAIGDRAAGPILPNRRGAQMDRHAATRRLRALAQATGMGMPPIHPHMLRHTYVTTMLDAGVDLRDVQIAAAHADPRTTMRYDRARNQLDRHPNYILAAYMASGT